ncbi:MAG TPA: hypothetical protein VG869_00440 [Acidimicrobiia bacterium]|nr:hypothetical protein [Acidimicrobiia bacterium]
MHRVAGVLLAGLSAVAATPAWPRSSPAGVPNRAEPVVTCAAVAGGEGSAPPPIPRSLPVRLTDRAAARVRAYSDGFVTVIAPRGWLCAGLSAADGGQSLSVFPPGQPNPLGAGRLPAHAAGVTAIREYTGHGPGAQLVCALFPGTRAARLGAETGGCTPSPRHESVHRPRRGVATFLDPPGVRGSGEPSGADNRAYGAVVYPRLSPEPDSVDVAKVTCTLSGPTEALCPSIVDDFVTRTEPAR